MALAEAEAEKALIILMRKEEEAEVPEAFMLKQLMSVLRLAGLLELKLVPVASAELPRLLEIPGVIHFFVI